MTYLPDTPRPVRYLTALATAFAGLFTMIAILVAMGEGGGPGNPMLAGAFLGAGCSGLALAGMLGHRQEDGGIWIGVLGAILATGLGSFLGGGFWAFLSMASTAHFPEAFLSLQFVAGLLQAGLLAFTVVMIFVPSDFPHVVGIWIILMTGVHLAALRARQRTAA